LNGGEADDNGGFSAEDAAAKNPWPGFAGQLGALSIGETAFGADKQDDSLWRRGFEWC